MIGRAITKALLEKNYKVIILSRSARDKHGQDENISYALWNVEQQTINEEAIGKADYIIHLAGEGIADKRWSNKRKQQIRDSRVKGGELLSKALKDLPNKVKAVVCASAIGWYGEDPAIPNSNPFVETAQADNGFLGQTCLEWEKSTEPIAELGKRVVKYRTGIVLSNDGGALKEFEKPLRLGIAAILGSGKQVISWIHIDDLVRLYITAIESDDMRGVFNAVAPRPVSNKELTLQLARTKKGSFFIPLYVPSFVLKAVLGEMSIEVLKSTTVSCDKIHYNGFTFLFPAIETALNDLNKKAPR